MHGIRKVRELVKLTDQHVYPDLIKRQTRKLANQVFSADVASGLQSLAGCPGNIYTKSFSIKLKVYRIIYLFKVQILRSSFFTFEYKNETLAPHKKVLFLFQLGKLRCLQQGTFFNYQ